MADERDRLPRVIEGPHQAEHGFRAPQFIGRITARDDKRVEISRGNLVDGGVDRHRPVAFLARHRLVIKARDGHCDVLLAQAVKRIQQLHVLELISREQEDFPICKHHGTDLTPSQTARRPEPGDNGRMADPDFRRDLYRGTARYYDRFRVPYPRSLIDDLAERSETSGEGRLLDLACGTGQISFALHGYFKEVWAVDQEPDMVGVVQEKAEAAGIGNISTSVLSRAALGGHAPDFEEDLRRELRAGSPPAGCGRQSDSHTNWPTAHQSFREGTAAFRDRAVRYAKRV